MRRTTVSALVGLVVALGLLPGVGPVIAETTDGSPLLGKTWEERYVLGVANLEGLNGTQWLSSLEVCNLGGSDQEVLLELLLRSRQNPDPVSTTLQLEKGSCVRYEDVIGTLFGLDSCAGAIRISSTDGGIYALARTANNAPAGRYGAGLAARSAGEALVGGERAVLIHLAESADDWVGFRTNIDLLNLNGWAASVAITLYDGNGVRLGAVSESLAPYEYEQLTRVFAAVTSADVQDGFAVVQPVVSSSTVLTSASLVENQGGDVVSIPAMRLEEVIPPEELSLTTEDGVLAATLFPVEDASLGVVLAHSAVPPQNQLGLYPLARDLANLGATVLTFDILGYGQSGGSRDEITVITDVSAAIDHLRTLGYRRIALLGVGYGAFGCAEAGRQANTVGLVLISCPISVPPIGPGPVVTREDMAPLDYPKLIIAAEDDYKLGRPFAEYARTLYDYSPQPKTLEIYPGRYHSMELFYSEHGNHLHELIMEFFADLL